MIENPAAKRFRHRVELNHPAGLGDALVGSRVFALSVVHPGILLVLTKHARPVYFRAVEELPVWGMERLGDGEPHK